MNAAPKRDRNPSLVDDQFHVVTTDDGSRTLYSSRDGETYHSESGAIAESQHVFVINSGVDQRLRQKQTTRVMEIGFGAGLNFFLTVDIALKNGTKLEYVAYENHLLPPAIFDELQYDRLIESSLFKKTWNDFYRGQFEGRKKNFSHKIENVEFFLINERFGSESTQKQKMFNVIYFDAFSPHTNPELWTEGIFAHCKKRLETGGCLVTYCVKSSVQKDLRNAGFQVKKTAGPVGGKREVLIATNVDRTL